MVIFSNHQKNLDVDQKSDDAIQKYNLDGVFKMEDFEHKLQ
jgi:hypothetical protein